MTLYLLMTAILFQGVSALAGGIGLLGDPTGSSIGIPLEWLEGSPFPNYLIPGLILFTVLGIGPLLVFAGLWKRKRWGWTGSILVGAALVIWILVEIMVIGYHPRPPLQAIYGALGILILALACLPGTRAAFARH